MTRLIASSGGNSDLNIRTNGALPESGRELHFSVHYYQCTYLFPELFYPCRFLKLATPAILLLMMEGNAPYDHEKCMALLLRPRGSIGSDKNLLPWCDPEEALKRGSPVHSSVFLWSGKRIESSSCLFQPNHKFKKKGNQNHHITSFLHGVHPSPRALYERVFVQSRNDSDGYVIEKCRVRWPADGRNMQFHFNTADTREIFGD